MSQTEIYGSLMNTIRNRFDTVETLRQLKIDAFSQAESAAFHGRKIIEGIAFASLVALENGLKHVPRDAKGQWNAESIFLSLKCKNLEVLPSPCLIRPATPKEDGDSGAKVTIEGVPDRRLTYEQLVEIYRRLHGWLHEINPYTKAGHDAFYSQKNEALWKDLNAVRLFIERHFISIQGAGFFCVLWDSKDNGTKVLPLTKA